MMKVTRLVGFGTICVSAGIGGIGVWACVGDSTTNPVLAPDGGPIVTSDATTSVDTGIPSFDAGLDAALWCGNVDGGAQSRCATYQWDDFTATDAGADADANANLGAAN